MSNLLKKNLGESIRQRLKNLSKTRNRPFDEILRYYAIERFLYRLGNSVYAKRFFLKGGLMLKIWDEMDHRATMDIDLLARTSNNLENLKQIIHHISEISYVDDSVRFNTKELRIHETQIDGQYHGVSVSFSAQIFRT